ncbi:MAG: hypothetical protein MUF50_04985 [Planctomycetes bacterium]|jgi:hypothetical protein|nr:hypothetical protein [Planctomycetota bacterium]
MSARDLYPAYVVGEKQEKIYLILSTFGADEIMAVKKIGDEKIFSVKGKFKIKSQSYFKKRLQAIITGGKKFEETHKEIVEMRQPQIEKKTQRLKVA